MSLINDALKKAQKQRTGDSPPLASMPSVGGEPAARIAKRAKPIGFNTLLLRAGLGAGALLVLVIGGWFIVRSKPAPPAAETGQAKPGKAEATPPSSHPLPPESSVAAAPGLAEKAAGPVTQLQATNPATQPAGGSFALPAATAAELAASTPVTPPPAKPAVKAPEPTAPKPPPPPAKLEPRAINFIENIRIAGIRASANDSKVLMNDRVYRVGDIVEHDMGLKLTGITSNSLTFEDEHGGHYTRTF